MERRATRTSLSRTGSTPPTAPSADQTITQVSSADLEAQLKHYETIYQKIKVEQFLETIRFFIEFRSPSRSRLPSGGFISQSVIQKNIQDATGVSSIAEAVNRFESQGETASHLQNLKRENENKLATLKEEKARLERKDY